MVQKKTKWLVGMPRSGKSTLLKRYQCQGLHTLDLDDYLLAYTGFKDMPSLYLDLGEKDFRILEVQCLSEIKGYDVIALGGGG